VAIRIPIQDAQTAAVFIALARIVILCRIKEFKHLITNSWAGEFILIVPFHIVDFASSG